MADFDFDPFDVTEPDDVEEPSTVTVGTTDIDTAPGSQVVGATSATLSEQQQDLVQTAVDDYYNNLQSEGLIPSLGRDYSKFELVGGRLRLKGYPGLELVNARTSKPLALTTVNSRRGGAAAIRDELGFVDWQRGRLQLPAEAVTALQTASDELGATAASVDTVEMQDLGQTATDVSKIVETAFTESELNKILDTLDDSPLNTSGLSANIRELRGLDRALQTVRGELTNNLARLTALDNDIAVERRKLSEATEAGVEEFTRRRVAERLRNFEDERASRLEAAAANREALRSQISRIRETIGRLLNEDTTLAERIRTLFREQGITVVAVLTAIGMAISTLVLALTGGGARTPVPTPTPPPDKNDLKQWVKNHLHALGRALAKLAGKMAAALPGIIGSVVSWLLSLLAKTAGWLAENLWAAVLAVVSLLLVVGRDWLSAN